jgi:hypothetical protein
LHYDFRAIKTQHATGIALRRGVGSNVGVCKKLGKLVFAIHVVVTLQERAPKAFAETPWPQENRGLVAFQFPDIGRFIYKVLAIYDYFLVISDGIRHFPGNAAGNHLHEAKVCRFGHTCSTAKTSNCHKKHVLSTTRTNGREDLPGFGKVGVRESSGGSGNLFSAITKDEPDQAGQNKKDDDEITEGVGFVLLGKKGQFFSTVERDVA